MKELTRSKTNAQKLQRATAYKETFENSKESTLEEVPEDNPKRIG